MSTAFLKRVTGRILHAVVGLHISSIGRHVRKYQDLADAAAVRSKQAESDVRNAKKAYANAIDAEMGAVDEAVAVIKAAHAEIAELPSVNGYGAVRASPPFGAKPVVIDKRNE